MACKNNSKKGIKKLKSLIFTSKTDLNNFRSKIEESFYTPFLPNHVECTEKSYGSVKCDFLSPEIYSSKRIVFYVHGGCFVAGSKRSYRGFCSLLANKSFSRVVVPEYRLAPTHAFPSAIEDIQTSFRALFTEEQIARSLEKTENIPENSLLPEIVIAADGAGATIALALVLNLRERYRKCIKKIVLFSPWLNVSPNSELLSGKKSDDGVMSTDCLLSSSQAYTYSSNLENPQVSPIFATDESLKDFPEVYIQIGSKEILLKDVKNFKNRLESLGNVCTVQEYKNMPHLFQLDDEDFLEAYDALDDFSAQIVDKNFENQKKFENQPRLEKQI